MNGAPNCYACKHRRNVLGSAHSRCVHPKTNGAIDAITIASSAHPDLKPIVLNEVGVTGDVHGIRSGWFMWPVNFDPAWLRSCNGFEPIESSQVAA